MSRESILLWFLRTYAANRRRYGEIFAAPGKWASLTMIRLRNTHEIDALVARVTE